MLGNQTLRRGRPRPACTRAARPALDRLEGRVLLYSTLGANWNYPTRVTYSIVPDGTSIGGTPSQLQNTLTNRPGWQAQFQKAAAIWEAVAGVNLVQVPDNGAPIGSGGDQQGDPGFGDIRIGGMTQSGSLLAFTYTPPRLNGGPLAGDIFFNTAQSWQIDGTTYDLLTVAVHEFGHALGMGHSATATADMYASYVSSNQALTSDDIGGIGSIYGARQNDAFDAAASNNSYTHSTNISPYLDGNGRIALANLDITTGSDVDWYKVTVPASTTGAMTLRMQSSGLSSLSPRVEVYTASLGYLGGAAAPNSYGQTVSGTVQGVAPGQTYYIKAMAANTGPSGVGGYGLLVNFGSGSQAAIAPPNTVVAAQPDQNPSTTPMGSGWVIGGQFVPLLGVLRADGIVLGDTVDGLYRITYGTLSGFGLAERVGDPARHDVHPGVGRGAGAMHGGGGAGRADVAWPQAGDAALSGLRPVGPVATIPSSVGWVPRPGLPERPPFRVVPHKRVVSAGLPPRKLTPRFSTGLP